MRTAYQPGSFILVKEFVEEERKFQIPSDLIDVILNYQFCSG